MIRLHPRSVKGNIIRTLRLIKNWSSVQAERIELIRELPFPSRYRKLYRDTLTFLNTSQYWSDQKFKQYQLDQLKRLIHHCYENVPYYQSLMKPLGFHPNDLRSLDQLQLFPFLTRARIEECFDSLIAKNYRKKDLEYFTTGGSMGIPMRFYLDARYTDTVRDAFFTRMWSWVRYRNYERGIILRGSVINSSSPNAYFDYNVFDNKLYVSSYHIKDSMMPEFYRLFVRFAPASIQSYPSALTRIAHYILDHQLPRIPSVNLILCGSENIYPWQRDLLEKAFGCHVYSWYGHSENVLLAGECEYNSEYHCFSEHGILELIRPDGTVIEGPDEVGEITGTGFINYAMPFIRYRTGDTASYASGPCTCGRTYRRLKRINGRLQEMFVTADRRYISMTAINTHSDIFDNVKQFQFVQDEPGKIAMKIIRKDSYSDQDSICIIRELKRKMGNEMDILLTFVDDIPLTSRGKHRFLVQNLKIQFAD